MPVSFPGPTPVPRQAPYPIEPAYGNIYGDIGQGLRQTGEDIGAFQEQRSREGTRQAKIQDMIERRKQALAVQAAREEWKTKDIEFREAKETQDVLESKRSYEEQKRQHTETQKRIKDEAALKVKEEEAIRTDIADFNKALDAERQKTGQPVSRQRTREIARGYPRVPDWEKYAGDRPYKPTAGVVSRQVKLAQYERLLPKLERQLEVLAASYTKATGEKFTVDRIIKSPWELDYKIQELEAKSEKRKYLERQRNIIRKKVEEIDKTKSFLEGIKGEGSAVEDVGEYNKAAAELEEMKKLLNLYPEEPEF